MATPTYEYTWQTTIRYQNNYCAPFYTTKVRAGQAHLSASVEEHVGSVAAATKPAKLDDRGTSRNEPRNASSPIYHRYEIRGELKIAKTVIRRTIESTRKRRMHAKQTDTVLRITAQYFWEHLNRRANDGRIRTGRHSPADAMAISAGRTCESSNQVHERFTLSDRRPTTSR